MKKPEEIIEALSPFVTERRKQRIKNVLSHRLSSIHLAMECPSDINNALAAIRTSEALGIDTVHIINPEGGAASARSVTQGAIYWVNVLYHDSLNAFFSHMKNVARINEPKQMHPGSPGALRLPGRQDEKFIIAGAKMDGENALSELPIDKPLCLLLGNENRGLSEDAINACDKTYHIPMCGMSESLNLSVSAAISLYDTTQRKRAALKSNGDLSEQEYLARQVKAYLQSVPKRLSTSVLSQP